MASRILTDEEMLKIEMDIFGKATDEPIRVVRRAMLKAITEAQRDLSDHENAEAIQSKELELSRLRIELESAKAAIQQTRRDTAREIFTLLSSHFQGNRGDYKLYRVPYDEFEALRAKYLERS